MATTLDALQKQYQEAKAKNLALDMTRGKPSPEQLDLALPMLDLVTSSDYKTLSGDDTRNYGGLDGIPEAKSLFKEFLEVSSTNEVIIAGNGSLTLMFDTMSQAVSHGVVGSEKPWGQLEKVKFLCPSPGYDRHFSICENLGIEMIPVGMDENGPLMDEVEKLVAADSSIKGIWVVPKYSNPTGISCSDEVVNRLASMKTAASDFRIFWDNAYTVHHLYNASNRDEVKDILGACKETGNANRVFIFGSMSKITFAGAAVAAMGGSEENMTWKKKALAFSTIGPDKVNQVRHTRFFPNMDAVMNHMNKHADILRAKFEVVLEVLNAKLGGKELATWTTPKGGYFISLDTNEGCAKRVVQLAAEAGVKLTAAGATFPYGKDPKDSNIRLAPSLPSVSEIRTAMEIVTLCVELADAEKKA